VTRRPIGEVPIEHLIITGLLALAALAVLAILVVWLFKSIAWIIKKVLGVRPESILTVCPHCAEETAENLRECEVCGHRLR
jgi:hypothetical protein